MAQHRSTHLVTVSVLVDGTNVSAQLGGLLSVSVYREFNKIPTARLLFQDGAVESQTFAKSDAPYFAPGKTLSVQVGYQNQEETIFKGIVVRHGVKLTLGKPSVLEVECKDEAVKMTLVRRSRYFYDQSDTALFRQILTDYPGLTTGQLHDTQHPHETLVQYCATDWDFLVLRAEANGLVVSVNDGQVNIAPPRVGTRADHTATHNQTVLELEAHLDGRTHWPAVEARTWDYTQQQLSAETANGTGGPNHFGASFYGNTPFPLYHGGDLGTEALQAWAAGKQTKSTLSQVRGRVRMRGLNAHPGQTLALTNVGDRFNGQYLISGVMHQVYGGTWQTDVQLGLSTQDFAAPPTATEAPAAGGLFPGVRGLHTGVVSKVGGDTREGHHRVQVRIPYLADQPSGEQGEGIWARLGTLYAGADRGFNFRPEVGDEVILGFVNDDPNDAIVLGALHSNQRSAPFEASDDNFQKGFVAKSGMRLVFDDDAKSVQLDTAAGYSILLSEKDNKLEIKDKNNHSIVLDADGITLNSTKNITLKAAQNVKIEGTRIDLN